MRPHLPEEELHAWLDAQLSRAQSREIAEHLLGCLICRALEAEVRAVRDRSTALLALAAPAVIRRTAAQRVARRQLRGGPMAVAAAVIIGLGSWTLTNSDTPAGETPRLSAAFVAPAILARVTGLPGHDSSSVDPSLLPATPSARTLTLVSRATRLSPRVIAVRQTSTPVSARRLRLTDPMLEVGPGDRGGWETASLAEAREAVSGALAHLDGVAVNAVRLQPSGDGGRPTAMVRHLLPDGRAVWVIEGAPDDVAPIYQVLEASGFTLTSPRRARPDYRGPDDAPIRSSRVVAVASFLPIDSLESLAGTRLKLD